MFSVCGPLVVWVLSTNQAGVSMQVNCLFGKQKKRFGMCRKADNPWLLSDNDFVFTSFTEMYLHVLLISKYKYEFLVLLLFNFYLTQKTALNSLHESNY